MIDVSIEKLWLTALTFLLEIEIYVIWELSKYAQITISVILCDMIVKRNFQGDMLHTSLTLFMLNYVF